MAKKAAPKAQEFIEKQMWKAVGKLRGCQIAAITNLEVPSKVNAE